MIAQTSQLIVAREDHRALVQQIEKNKFSYDGNASKLLQLEDAEVLDEAAFPWEVVRLNTKVIIRDKLARLNYTYIVVLPEFADHRKCKVSVFSPIGSALFGYRRGEDTYWLTPKGKRYFTIMAVSQHNY